MKPDTGSSSCGNDSSQLKDIRGTALLAPRLLTRTQAALYCALSPRSFAAWVKCGRLPGPIKGTARWDRQAIDAAIDATMLAAEKRTGGESSNPYENWKAHYDEDQLKRNPYNKEETR